MKTIEESFAQRYLAHQTKLYCRLSLPQMGRAVFTPCTFVASYNIAQKIASYSFPVGFSRKFSGKYQYMLQLLVHSCLEQCM